MWIKNTKTGMEFYISNEKAKKEVLTHDNIVVIEKKEPVKKAGGKK